jgi:hypothetical protein
VNGLYQVLADVRARYPDLLIENVSGGGNRLDSGCCATPTWPGWTIAPRRGPRPA